MFWGKLSGRNVWEGVVQELFKLFRGPREMSKEGKCLGANCLGGNVREGACP